jgi:hypothetical protein
MGRSNLKAVRSGKPEQLSLEEIRRVAKGLGDTVCQDDDAVELLLLLAVHMMEHCSDMQYMDNIGMTLAQQLFTETLTWSDTVLNHAEEYRRKAVLNA